MKVRLKYTTPQLDIFFPEDPARHTIIPKGRRFGATHGAANACIEWGLEGMPILWGDTINGNISRYVERYFLPTMRKNGIEPDWNDQKKVLKVGTGYVDFRSADRPENWEGFGYRKIVLNEAGIILADPYLYTNAVRPMMLDFPDAELFALGVPKGKMLKSGQEHPFYSLWQKVGTSGYRGRAYSSRDNPLISEADVDELERDMDPAQVPQEIYGQFIDRIAGRPFAFAWDRVRHVKPCQLIPGAPVIVSVDFNLDPFCAIIAQDQGKRFAITNEVSVKSGTLEELCARILAIAPHVHLHKYTGDRTGASRRIQAKSTASLWEDLLKVMRARLSQLDLPANPSHKQSREDTNYVLHHHPDFVVDPSCTGLIFDFENVEVDDDLSIIKSDRSKLAQRADFLDTGRAVVNTYLRRWIEQHKKHNVLQPLSGGVAARPLR